VAPRFIVGIDLGTTNCALAAVSADAADEQPAIEVREVPQLVNPHEVASRALLPSFLYLPSEVDFAAGSLVLPWKTSATGVVGELARKRGAENPVRLVASAKSWLSYAAANRNGAILPWGAPAEVEKISPVEASAAYLRHLRDAWNHETDGRLEDQDVLLTVPASFDEEARVLTVRAAEDAGLGHVTLLEEPQAAFYAWIAGQGDRWRRRVRVGDLVLVCDVGGGTTDFSLIAVSEEGGELRLERVAVGEHILLGGDNMDLALARVLQGRLEEQGHKIDTWQLHGLWHQARLAKEALFGDPSMQSHPVTLLGRGSKVIGGSIRSEVTATDLRTVLLDGFLPRVPSDTLPARQRRVGFQELGLPYAADAAITRHLAKFLRQPVAAAATSAVRRGSSGLACPTHVLFNGGVMKAPVLRERIVEVLNAWLAAEGFEPLGAEHVLDAPDLDHAVARGAAYYGRARMGRGVRIRSGAPRSYYIGIESAMPAVPGMPAPLKALCVVPFGMEEGTSAAIDRPFGLIVGEPAEFRFLSSGIRKGDAPGTLVEDWGDDIEELSPLEVTLRLEGRDDTVLPVTLESKVTEVGTLELWCVSRDEGHRWKLELNIREHER
jgi:molecular chaperone DnaK (HSP70)